MPPEIPAPLPQAFNVAAHFIDRPAQEHPGRVAILGEPAAVTYAELSLLVNRVGNALRGSKRQPGERVLIVLPDSAEFIASFFGAAKVGAVAVRSEEHTSELQSRLHLVCRLLLEKKNNDSQLFSCSRGLVSS